MSVILGRRHRLLHVRTLPAQWDGGEQEISQIHHGSPLDCQLLQEGATPRAPLRKEAGGSRVLHRELAPEEMQEETVLGYSRLVHPRWKVPQEHAWRRTQCRNLPWDGQIGERRPHAPRHSRWNSSVSKQLVDPFEHGEFRHDARKASSWFQTSLNNFATAQEPGGYSLLPKVAKLFLILVELARILVAIFIWVSPRRWTQHWSIRETWWAVIGPFIRGMILRIILVQNYNSNSVIANGSSLSPTVGVKSISPVQQNSMTNGFDENKDYGNSCENKCATNYSIITNINWNNTRNMQLTMHNKYTNDDVHYQRLRGAHHALSLHIARTVPHLMMTPHTSWLKFWASGNSIWKELSQCQRGTESCICCSGKLSSETTIWSWSRHGGEKKGKGEARTWLSTKPIDSLNLRDWSRTKRTDPPIKPREKEWVQKESWKWEIDSSKKVEQEIAKKFRNYADSVSEKARQSRTDEWSDPGIAEQSEFPDIWRTSSRPWGIEQLWSILRSQRTVDYSESQRQAQPRACNAEWYTERCGYFGKRNWKPTCSRRTIFSSLLEFQEFGIISLRNEPRQQNDTRSTVPNTSQTRVQEPWFHTGGTCSHDSVMDYPRYSILECILENSRRFGISKLGSQLQVWSMRRFTVSSFNDAQDHRGWAGKVNKQSFDVAIDYRTNRFPRLRFARFEDCVCREEAHHEYTLPTKSVQNETLFLRGREIAFIIYEHFSGNWSVWCCASAFLISSLCSCRSISFRISIQDGTKLCYQQLKYLQKWCWKVCTSQNYKILFSFRRLWYSNKRLFETMNSRTIPIRSLR